MAFSLKRLPEFNGIMTCKGLFAYTVNSGLWIYSAHAVIQRVFLDKDIVFMFS